MTEMTPFERQVEDELQGMVGPIPRFDAIEIAETAVAAGRPSLRWPKLFGAFGLAAAAGLLLLAGISLYGRLMPSDDRQFVVALDGTGNYTSVTAAVDVAGDGDVIWLAPGEYEETIEVTSNVEIRADGEPGDVVFHVTDAGPAFRLRDADATISGITFISHAPADPGSDRRPVLDIRGGRPVIENLVVRADAPVDYRFIRLNGTGEGTIIRDNRSSGSIIANQGAVALIERNQLLHIDDPDWPVVAGRHGVGIELERSDVDLTIRGNELNTISVVHGHAEIVDNEIHGTTEPLTVADFSGGSVLSGECGVSSFTVSQRPVLIDNRIYDHGTGVCGRVDLRGGEIHDNGVGLFVGAGDPSIPSPAATARGVLIHDNGVGIELEPFMGIILTDVALCANGVDIDAPRTATITRTGSTDCDVREPAPTTDSSLVVAPEGTGAFRTIAEAVAAASDGDVVRLEPGIYREAVEVTRDIEIRGQDGVTFHIPSDGPAFELTDADAVISDITFISQPRDDSDKRRPAIIATGGAPVFERLIAHADAPVPFDFIRLYATERGSVIRDSVSSGVIQANRGAQALIENNLLVRQQPDAPGAGVALARYDTFLRIVGNEMNYVDVAFAQAEIVGNDIHGARPLVSQSKATNSFREGACGVGARPGVVLLTANRIHDNETGVCGQVQVVDGEFYDNTVGIWATGLNGSKVAEAMMDPASIRDAVIRGNEVGIRAAPSSKITLLGVALCDNSVDVEDEGAAVLEQLEPAECAS